jgi:hypothetical protein
MRDLLIPARIVSYRHKIFQPGISARSFVLFGPDAGAAYQSGALLDFLHDERVQFLWRRWRYLHIDLNNSPEM